MHILGLLVMLGAACGADDDASVVSNASDTAFDAAADTAGGSVATSADAVEDVMEESEPAVAPAADGERALGSGGTNAQVDPASLGREIIYTADLTVAVDDVTAAGAEAARIVGNAGGLLFGQETYAAERSDDGRPQGATSRLTFRIRPADFQKVLGGLSALGEVRNQVVSTEDVTGRVVDLESRITTSETSVERIRELLGSANDVETVTALEQQLLERETTLELLRGQLRQVRDQVDLATIHLTLTEALANPGIQLLTSWYAGHDDDGAACPGGGSAIDEGGDVTICFEVVNTGDVAVGSLELTDSVLGIDQDALVVVYGDDTTDLQPGQSLVWAYETAMDRFQRLRTRVTATPVNIDGDEVDGRTVQASAEPGIPTTDNDSLPGFGDAVAGGWSVLRNLVQVLVLAVGALLPFIWLVPVIWLVRRFLRSRADARPSATNDDSSSTTAARTPPPPAATNRSGDAQGAEPDTGD